MTRRPFNIAAMDYETIRHRKRRKLLFYSLPVMVVIVVVATKLVIYGAVAMIGDNQYKNANYSQAASTYRVNLLLNMIDPYLSDFAHGTAALQAGDLDSAEHSLTTALAEAPSPFVCFVRANLALVYERQADSLVKNNDDKNAVTKYSAAIETATGDNCTQPRSGASQQEADARQQAAQTEKRSTDKSNQAKQRNAGDKSGTPVRDQAQSKSSNEVPSDDQIKRLQESQEIAQRNRQNAITNNAETEGGQPNGSYREQNW